MTTLPTDYSPGHWQAMKEMAKEFHLSGALPKHLENAHRVVMVLQAGAEMGIPPMQAVNTLYIVNGKVAMEGRAMLKQIIKGGVKVKWKESTNEKCTVELTREGEEPYEETFTIEDARTANLLGKDNWKKFPKVMLRWRALSQCSRFYCPDIIESVYLVEELADSGTGAKWAEDGTIQIENKSPVAEKIMDMLRKCKNRNEYLSDILPEINDSEGLSYDERAAITQLAEERLDEFAKESKEEKPKKNKEVKEAEVVEEEVKEDVTEITKKDMDKIISEIRDFTKQSPLVEYIQDKVNPLPLNKKQKEEIKKWVSNKIAQLNEKIPTEEDLKQIFGS